MTTPTKHDLLSLSDRAFKIAFFYFMPALFVGGFAFLGWRQCSRPVPPEPASPSSPDPQPECRYPRDNYGSVSVACPSSLMRCVVCSDGRCSTFNPHNCPELKP